METATTIPLVGAQVWIEPEHTPEQIGQLFAGMAEARLSLARVWVAWSLVEPNREQWEFTLFDVAFDAAARYGIRIAATLTANMPPAHRAPAGASVGGVTATRELMLEADQYIKRVVQRYRQHPALHTWILMNEPGQAPQATPLAVEEFRSYLTRQYGSVEALNRAWRTSFASVEEVNPPQAKPAAFERYELFVDWHRFFRHHVAWQMKHLADSVARHDARTPVHINPHALLGNPAQNSLDLPLLASTVDQLGGSCHPSWHFSQEVLAHSDAGVGMIADLLRPASQPKPFWITELQGGTNWFSGVHPICPSGATLQRWVWECVFAGAQAIVFWLWKARRDGFEAGEWGLSDLYGRPTDRSAAVAQVVQTLSQHSEAFAGAAPAPRRVAILSDLDTHTLLLREAVFPGRSPESAMTAIARYALALRRLGVDADIVTTGSETEPNLGEYTLIIAPSMYAISETTARALRTAVERGAHLWADGLFAAKTPQGRLVMPAPQGLADVFGARLTEFRKLDRPATFRVNTTSVRTQGMIGLLSCDFAQPLAWWNDQPVAATRAHGSGRATWLAMTFDGDGEATVATLAELLRPHVQQAGLASPARQRLAQAGLLTRAMQSGERTLLLALNPTRAPQTLDALKGAELLAASAGSTITRVAAEGWVVARI